MCVYFYILFLIKLNSKSVFTYNDNDNPSTDHNTDHHTNHHTDHITPGANKYTSSMYVSYIH